MNNGMTGRVVQFPLHGVNVCVETVAGGLRIGKTITSSYGHAVSIVGADGEDLDVYIGDNLSSPLAFAITQLDPETGDYDEDKIMLGFLSPEAACLSYCQSTYTGMFGGIKSWRRV